MKPKAEPEPPLAQPIADQAAPLSKKPAQTNTRPSRIKTKHVGGYFDPAVSKQLRSIALDEDTSVQALVAEALDMLFHARRKPPIAQKAKAWWGSHVQEFTP